ncbi:nicotinate-nucleotide adenylyltransferase [Kingella oralis]|uniref:nicotinate-nucleotide adenylyltransferase n=1 Tax=Kingella oralis TaxID=505 RepID=UPI0034E3C5F3
MNKLGLFGGSFDPIHNGHLHIARAFADELALDSVIFLPAGDPYHKNATSASAAQRLAMVEAAIESDSRFAASDVDMVRDGATYSVDTVQIFRQHFADAELWWLMGMDSLLQLHTWKNWRTFARLTHIAVAARSGQSLNHAPRELQDWLGEALHNGSLKILSAPLWDVSSSAIRQRVAAGESVGDEVPAAVEQLIEEWGLYRGEAG